MILTYRKILNRILMKIAQKRHFGNSNGACIPPTPGGGPVTLPLVLTSFSCVDGVGEEAFLGCSSVDERRVGVGDDIVDLAIEATIGLDAEGRG